MYAVWLESVVTGTRTYLSKHSTNPVVSMAYKPDRGDGQSVKEMIEFTLRGSLADVEEYLQKLGRLFDQAKREARMPGGDWVLLCVEDDAGGDEWQAIIFQGAVESGTAGLDQRAGGSLWCKVNLLRSDWWDEASAASLGRSVYNDAGTLPVTITNHADADHGNWINVPRLYPSPDVNVSGDLSGALTFWIELVDGTNTNPWTFIIGETHGLDADQLTTVYQGEAGGARAGAVGSNVADAGCANGYYKNLAWTGAADVELWSCDLAAADVRRSKGYSFRPVMRLQASLPTAGTEKIWYRWKVYRLVGGSEYLMCESAAMFMEQGQQLIMGPAVRVPPWSIDQANVNDPGQLRLVLAGSAAGSGAHVLKIDFVQLFGLDGWRIYRPLTAEPSRSIHDNGYRWTVTTHADNYQSHAAEGPGLTLIPGRAHRFFILGMENTGADLVAPIDEAFLVGLEYRRRRWAL